MRRALPAAASAGAYASLFEALQGEDIHRAYGGITLPNEASIGLHVAMGFRHIGTYREVGRKFGGFWDVALYERAMRPGYRSEQQA